MKELIYAAAGELRWQEAPEPRITGPAQALVRPVASAFCDLDRRIRAGATPFKPGFAIGHEAVAEVVEIGAAVENVRVGDLVSVPWKISCGKCAQCQYGRTSACTAVQKYAAYGAPIGGLWGGLFSELVNVPFADAMLVKLPDDVEPASVAAASDNLTDAWAAVSKPLAARPGGRVLVAGGTESLGVLAVQLAKAAGASQVTYHDADPYRQALARQAGAQIHEGDEQALYEQFDVSISATRDHEKLKAALLGLAPGGHCSCIGIIFDDPKIPLFSMYLRDITLSVGLCSVRPHIPKVLDLVRQRHCDPMAVTQVVAMEDAADALALNPGKVVAVRPRITSH